MSSFDLSGYLLVGKNSLNQNTGDTNALLSNEDLINKLIQDKQNILMVEESEKFLKAEAARRGISGGDFPSFDYMPFVIILLVSLVICIFVIALGNAFPFIPSSVITLLCLIVIAIGAMLSFREYTYYAAYYTDATIRMNQNYLDKTNANQCVGPVCCSDASGTVWDPIKSICVVKPSAVSSSNAMPISSAYNPQQSYADGRRDANQLLSLFNGQLNSGSNYIPGGNQPLSEQQSNAQSTLLSGILSYLNKDASVGAGAPPSTSTSTNVENTPTPSSTPSAQPVRDTPSPSANSGPVSSVYGGDAAVLYNSVPYTANGSFLFNGKMITDPEITSRYYLNDDDGFKYSIVDYNGVANTVSVIFPDPANKGYTVRRDNLYCSFSNCGKKITNVLYRTFNKETPYVQSAADAQSAAATTAYNSNTGLVSSYTGMGSDGSSTSNENYYYTYNGKNYTMSSITQMVPFMIGTVLVDDIVNSGYTVLLSSVTPVMKKTIGTQYKYISISKPFSSTAVVSSGPGSVSVSVYGSGSVFSASPANTLMTTSLYASGSGSWYGSGSGSGSVYGSGSGSVYGSGSGSGSVYGSGSGSGSGSGLVPKFSASTFYQFEANSSTILSTPLGCYWRESNNPNFVLSVVPMTNIESILNQTYLNNKPSFVFKAASLFSDSLVSTTPDVTNFTCFLVININTFPTDAFYNNILSFGKEIAVDKLLQIKLSTTAGITSLASNINGKTSDNIPVNIKSPFILMVNFYQKTSSYGQVVLRANSKITTQFINASTSVNTTGIDIGSCRVDKSPNLKPFDGGISEFLFYDTTANPFTDSYISQVENYLSKKWNIPIQQVTSTGSGSIPSIIPDPKILFKPSSPILGQTSTAFNKITINFTMPTDNIPITGYKAYYKIGSDDNILLSTTTATATSSPINITIPSDNIGKTYYFYIVAYNAIGESNTTPQLIPSIATIPAKPKPSLSYYVGNDWSLDNDLSWWRDGNDILIDVSKGENLTHCRVWVQGGGNGGGFDNGFPGVKRYVGSSDLIPVIGGRVRVSPSNLKLNGDKYRITIQGYNDQTQTFTTDTTQCDYYWLEDADKCYPADPGQIRSRVMKWGF